MRSYRLEVFEPHEGIEPVLRHRREFQAASDAEAIEVAKSRYRIFSGDVKLAGFVLYDGERVVYERSRLDED